MKYFFAAIISASLLLNACNPKSKQQDYSGWPAYSGSKNGLRYSSNDQINAGNVTQLEVAWTYSSNDKDPDNRSQNQCNPIMVDGILYGTSPRLKLFALNATTGEVKWELDPATKDTAALKDKYAYYKVNRGVVYWENESGDDKRILYSTGSKTYAIDAVKGEPITSFGKGGFIDISENLDREA